MRNKSIVCLFSFLISLVSTSSAFALGREGHETTGIIAAKLIHGTRAEKEVAKILKSGEDLSSASRWADCAKGFRYCRTEPTAEMKDYVRKNPNHRTYHYADVPFQDGVYKDTAVGANPEDIVHILSQAIAALQGKTDTNNNPHGFTKREALFLVAHMVGDIHQPLHVGAAYLDGDDEFVVPKSEDEVKSGKAAETHGGNWLMLGSHNLHALWDTDLVQRAMRREHASTPQEFADALLVKDYPRPSQSGNATTWPKKWANESVKLSKTVLETVTTDERSEVEDKDGSHSVWTITLPRTYMPRGTIQIGKQVYLAGYRMAEILKAVWP